MPHPDWLFGHDPQEYAYEEFLTIGPYTPRNVPPPGETHRTENFTGKKLKAWLNYDRNRTKGIALRAKTSFAVGSLR